MNDAKEKKVLYLGGEAIEWLQREARRQDRSLSWIVQACITLARDKVERFPSIPPSGGSR